MPNIDPAQALSEILSVLKEIAESLKTGQPESLSPPQAAEFLSISPAQFHSLNNCGLIPSPAYLSERVPRWTRTELKAWLLAGAPARIRWVQMKDAAMRKSH